MAGYRRMFISFASIVILILLLVRIRRQDTELIDLKDGFHLSLDKKCITIYDSQKQKIDSYTMGSIIMDYCLGDIDGDGLNEIIILSRNGFNKYGNSIKIFKCQNQIENIYEGDYSELKPWKIAVGDIDGDAKDEISIGVYKKTPYHKVMAKRPFIYYFKNGGLLPKWRGSRLSKPFVDYGFCDVDGDGMDEIIAIEVLNDTRKVINSYKWKGFGFEGFAESGAHVDLKGLRIDTGNAYVDVINKGENYTGLINLQGDILEIERVITGE